MRVRHNNTFGEFLTKLMEMHGITSSRQARIRTGISHTTIEALLAGTQPSVETALRIASGFKADQVEALRAAGFDELADDMQAGIERAITEARAANVSENDTTELTYEPLDHDEEEVVSFYRGMAPTMRPAAKAALKAMLDAMPDAEDWPTYGRGTGSRKVVKNDDNAPED